MTIFTHQQTNTEYLNVDPAPGEQVLMFPGQSLSLAVVFLILHNQTLQCLPYVSKGWTALGLRASGHNAEHCLDDLNVKLDQAQIMLFKVCKDVMVQ